LYGVECQIFKSEEFLAGHRFDLRLDPSRSPRELAIQWAEEMRKEFEKGTA
jgi:hypothetical protein